MNISTAIITIIGAILGTGGITAFVSTILSARKFKAEAHKIESESDNIQSQNDMAKFEFINKRLKEISDNAEADSRDLRARNNELNSQIAQLNDKLQTIMEWVIYDNQKYRNWLETELRKSNPDIQFPECPPPPKIFGSASHKNDE